MDRDIEEIFKYHVPKDERIVESHQSVRSILRDTSELLENILPQSYEKGVVRDRLREAMYWANAAIAIHSNKG